MWRVILKTNCTRRAHGGHGTKRPRRIIGTERSTFVSASGCGYSTVDATLTNQDLPLNPLLTKENRAYLMLWRTRPIHKRIPIRRRRWLTWCFGRERRGKRWRRNRHQQFLDSLADPNDISSGEFGGVDSLLDDLQNCWAIYCPGWNRCNGRRKGLAVRPTYVWGSWYGAQPPPPPPMSGGGDGCSSSSNVRRWRWMPPPPRQSEKATKRSDKRRWNSWSHHLRMAEAKHLVKKSFMGRWTKDRQAGKGRRQVAFFISNEFMKNYSWSCWVCHSIRP